MSRLEPKEKEILDAYESGRLERTPDASAQIEEHRSIAEATFRKDSRINIRISSRDLRALQVRALQAGIPYQTLISSVLHKYADGRLVERSGEE